MDQYYLILLAFLGVIALIDLFVGVSNDAVNFLNSALGCRITSFRTTLWVASLGVLAGATFSSGMMEIARSGVFHPQLFTFSELMIIFFAVMVADVILLDAFNSMGLPTSTTVSIVFELLGSAFAAALFKLIDAGLPLTDVANYINSSKSLGIVSGILISVVVAFISGAVVQYLARLAFSFRFENAYRRIGAIYGGLALTAIIYFLVMKGAKGASFMRPEWISWINDNTAAILFTLFAGLTVFFQILIVVFRVNIFKIIILAGTFSLAFAFAGNDLVNFVGVPLAAWDSFQAWKASGVADTEFLMGGLLKPATAPTAFLLLSGFVMVLTLWFSKKAHRVIQTSINLSSSQSGGQEQFDATTPGRMIVRAAMSVGNVLHQIIPLPIQRGIQKRFEPLPVVKGEVPLPFDYVRASINLMVSAILIASATSLKLPLSTTYVTFMVAMGSSLADRAWGRDSAVYRITGVMVVIGGWFTTGLLAFLAAGITASVMMFGGMWGVVFMLLVAGGILVKSAYLHRRKNAEALPELNLDSPAVMRELGEASVDRLGRAYGIYRATVKALLAEDYSALKRLRKKARELNRTLEAIQEDQILPCLQTLPARLYDRGQLVLRLHENSLQVAGCLLTVVKASYKHIDNNHVGLTAEQGRDLLSMSDRISACFPGLSLKLQSEGGAGIEEMMAQSGDLKKEFAQCIREHLIRAEEDVMDMRNGILYLNLLNETRAMVRHSFALLQDQAELFREHK